MSAHPPRTRPDRRGLALAALLSLALVAFAATRALRSQEDIVNTVAATPTVERGEQARVSFRLTRFEPRADVLIVDRDGQRVRALAASRTLREGPHTFRWDGRADSGEPVSPGPYRLRLVLAEQGREIEPPGTIVVRGGEDG